MPPWPRRITGGAAFGPREGRIRIIRIAGPAPPEQDRRHARRSPHPDPGGLTFLLAGLVKGLIGLGLPTVSIGLLSLVMAPAQAAALLVPSLVTNVWQLAAGPRFLALARRLWPMMLAICIGTWVGAGILTGGGARMALGGALAAHAILGLTAVRLTVPVHAEAWLSPLVDAVTGATGVFVIPAVPYLQALGLSFTVSTVALGSALAGGGALGLSVATSIVTLLPALGSMLFGQYVRSRPTRFRWG